MADACEARMPREAFQILRDFGRAEIHPANDRLHARVGVGEAEQPVAFLNALPRLHGHGAIESKRRLKLREVRREPVAMQRRTRRNPRILRGVVAPEMLVGVDFHHAPRRAIRRPRRKPLFPGQAESRREIRRERRCPFIPRGAEQSAV